MNPLVYRAKLSRADIIQKEKPLFMADSSKGDSTQKKEQFPPLTVRMGHPAGTMRCFAASRVTRGEVSNSGQVSAPLSLRG
jgi:hypothetical protein